MMIVQPYTFYEFFAGGGMVRAALGDQWNCIFANDFDRHKVDSYRQNWPAEELAEGDVWDLDPKLVPGHADLAWASSPCQDLSLAGRRAGLAGAKSSAFWGFWRIIEGLAAKGRAPRIIVIENVTGLLTSRNGSDFTALSETLARQGYWFGALEIDASLFTPQSRARVFIIATRDKPPADLITKCAGSKFHTRRVEDAFDRLPAYVRGRWLWWHLPHPPSRNVTLADVLQSDGEVAWHSLDQTQKLLSRLSPSHRQKLESARIPRQRVMGALFRRMRTEGTHRVQRAEVRFDGLAGCLRTPGGGSSRQFVIAVTDDRIRTRPLAAREAARLMGLSDDYELPPGATRAHHLMGDGVVVPLVRWLALKIIEPLAEHASKAGVDETQTERRRAGA